MDGVRGVAVALEDQNTVYFPVEGFQTEGVLCGHLEQLFAGDSQIGAWDVKAIRKKIEIPERKGIFDLGIGAYLLNPLKNDYTYDDVAKEYLGEQLPSQEEVFSGMKKPDPKKADNEQVAAYGAYQAYVALHGKDTLKKALQEAGMWDLFEDIEMPLVFTLDDMEKAAEKAREAADESNENLTFQNQIAQDYYKDQIELIDEKINALNKEAQAEDRLQKLQEARDAYERAKNTKNRLVLVRGAGWVFKRDQEELSSTYDALRDAEREVEIAKLNEEKELLQDQANAWAEKAENIGKTTEELEKYNKAYKEFSDMTEEQRKEALNAFIEAVIRNNQLNQDATDKENAFEDQSDAEKEGTLAWTSELIDKIGKSAEDLIKDNKINQVVDSLDNLLGDKGIEGLVSHLDTLTHGVNTYIDNFLKLSEQMTQNENAIDAIDKALEDWDELTENLGKSQSELNKELELFNYN